MNTKLTLRLDEALIRDAKRYARTSGKSVSQLVADYFALIRTREPVAADELTPRVRAMVGALGGAGVSDDDYARHLERKYRQVE